MRTILALISWLVAGVLLLFTARRWLFMLIALLPARRQARADAPSGRSELPPVLVLVPLRNEAEALPDLLVALDRLDYPPPKLAVALLNDGSTDATGTLIRAWVRNRPNWYVLSQPQNVGKAQILNRALAAFPQGEIIVIYDADERPCPTALRCLVAHFADERVGGVSGRRAVENPLTSPVASYTAFENLVHQLVTMRAKDRLKLAPAILGANCAYRRSALEQVGCFKPGALLEDSDLTLKLARAGWSIRYEPEAISYHRVPQTVTGYWQQHTRWARGFNDVVWEQGPAALTDRRLPPGLRLELLLFSMGYLDRVALLAAAGLALARTVTRRRLGQVIALSLLTPLLQVMAALFIDRAPGMMWRRLLWLPLFYLLDVAMSVSGVLGAIRRSPPVWEERRNRT